MLNSYKRESINYALKFWCDWPLLDILGEVVGSPAFTGTGHQEPVVVEPDLEAADLVITVAHLRCLFSLLRALVVE